LTLSFYQTAHTPLQLALVVMVQLDLRRVVTEQQVFSVLFLQLAVAVVGHLVFLTTDEQVGQVVALVMMERQAQAHREKATQAALDFKADLHKQLQAVAVAVKAQQEATQCRHRLTHPEALEALQA